MHQLVVAGQCIWDLFFSVAADAAAPEFVVVATGARTIGSALMWEASILNKVA